MEEKFLGEGGNQAMDELYTVQEMTKLLKVSRETLYRLMNDGTIPYFKIGAKRRFFARQVSKVLKDMQTKQIHAMIYGPRADKHEENEALSNVSNDTLSDVPESSSKLTPSNQRHLPTLRKTSDKVKKFKTKL